jgi:hypothetical protein
MKMKEPKTISELYYWLEVELSILHIMFYVIMGLILGGKWWILFGLFSFFSFMFLIKKAKKLISP